MRGEPRRGDRANDPSRRLAPALDQGRSWRGRRGALVGRQEHWPDLPALLRPSGRCTAPASQPTRPQGLLRFQGIPVAGQRTPTLLHRTKGGSDAPGHPAATGPTLTSPDSAWCPSEIAKETPWAPFHTAPHPSGSKDQAGLLRSPCSHSGGRRLAGVPRRSFHGDPLRSLLPDPCSGDACLSRWHQGLWP